MNIIVVTMNNSNLLILSFFSFSVAVATAHDAADFKAFFPDQTASRMCKNHEVSLAF